MNLFEQPWPPPVLPSKKPVEGFRPLEPFCDVSGILFGPVDIFPVRRPEWMSPLVAPAAAPLIAPVASLASSVVAPRLWAPCGVGTVLGPGVALRRRLPRRAPGRCAPRLAFPSRFGPPRGVRERRRRILSESWRVGRLLVPLCRPAAFRPRARSCRLLRRHQERLGHRRLLRRHQERLGHRRGARAWHCRGCVGLLLLFVLRRDEGLPQLAVLHLHLLELGVSHAVLGMSPRQRFLQGG